MRDMRDQTFAGIWDQESGAVFEGLRIRGCTFRNCGLSLTKSAAKRSSVRAVEVENTYVENCQVGAAIFEDVTIHDLSTNDLLIVGGALFQHVSLRGKIGKLKLNKRATVSKADAVLEEAFESARAEFYSHVDWALDISEAAFADFSVRGIPARLVRRNPEHQVAVTRARALDPAARARIAPWNEHWRFVIDMFLSEGDPDVVLVAPTRGKKKEHLRKLIDGLRDLREAGIVDEG